MTDIKSCATCHSVDLPLLQCARCKSVAYCNRSCQKADWKTHKQQCVPVAQHHGGDESSGVHTEQSPQPGEQRKKPFTAISNNKFLHDHSEEKTFQLLIDMLRMRQEDEYSLGGDTMIGTIYNLEPTSEKAFRTLIRKAKAVSGLLPPWWDQGSLDKCLSYARKSADFSLASAQEKHDIQETWADNYMPMKLRMVSERIYGYTPGGTKSDGMLSMMMDVESGAPDDLHVLNIDWAKLFK